MNILKIKGVGESLSYEWPEGVEIFDHYIDYVTLSEHGQHMVRLGFSKRNTYGKARQTVIIWIDETPYAVFIGTDDFRSSGDLVSEIKIKAQDKYRMCRYPSDHIPERYSMFDTVGLPLRVSSPGVHNAWAVHTNIADHKTMINLASLRMLELKELRAYAQAEERERAEA